MHRDLPRPPLRATPKALRCGRGSLLCMTGISPNQRTMRGRDWTRKGGRNWKRFDTLNGVDVDFAKTVAILITGILTSGVAHRLVAIAPSWQACVDVILIGVNQRARGDRIADDWLDRCLLHIGQHVQNNLSAALDQAEDRRLVVFR